MEEESAKTKSSEKAGRKLKCNSQSRRVIFGVERYEI